MDSTLLLYSHSPDYCRVKFYSEHINSQEGRQDASFTNNS